ncbi:MAG: ABC transporter substrate-binding protein [Halobacterium sp.]
MTSEHNSGLSRRQYVKATGATGAAAMTGLAGCSSVFGGGGTNPLEVAHWWTGGDGNDAITALFEGFKEKYPDIKVKPNPVAGGAGTNLKSKIKTQVLNGNPPSSWQIWPGEALSTYVEADALKDIESSVWGHNDMKNAYLPGVKEAAKPGGNFVTVPLNIHRLNNVFYNKNVVEQAGVDPTSASKPSELLEMVRTVDEETDAIGMANSTKGGWTTLQLWETILLGEYGESVYDAVTKGNLESNADAVKGALELTKQFKQYFGQDSGSIGWTQANNKVIDGNAGFIHQGDWAAGMYTGTDGFEYQKDWGHAVFPGTSGKYTLVMDSFPMPKNNPSPEATKKFLRYCGSVEGQKRFNPKKGSIPPRTDVPDDAFGPFLTSQKSDFSDSSSQPGSITHGLAVEPGTLTSLKTAAKAFTSNWNVEDTYSAFVNSFQ